MSIKYIQCHDAPITYWRRIRILITNVPKFKEVCCQYMKRKYGIVLILKGSHPIGSFDGLTSMSITHLNADPRFLNTTYQVTCFTLLIILCGSAFWCDIFKKYFTSPSHQYYMSLHIRGIHQMVHQRGKIKSNVVVTRH